MIWETVKVLLLVTYLYFYTFGGEEGALYLFLSENRQV